MILSRRAAVVVTASIQLAACGGAGASDESAVVEPSVIATTSIWADITSNVLCGRSVPSIVPAGADPHTFEPSLRDREMLDNAQVVIANGNGLEGGIADLLTTSNATVVELTNDSRLALIDGDPHIWQSPRLVARALDTIESSVRPLGIETCADEYSDRLDQLDLDIIASLRPLAAEHRVMVTSHDSLAYFAERYRLEIVGTVIPSTNTLAQTNAADLATLADVIEAHNVRAVFTEELESTADADALAERLGVAVVPLVTDALTDDPATDTYVEMMRSNATRIAEALAP